MVILGSPNTLGHSPKARLVVTGIAVLAAVAKFEHWLVEHDRPEVDRA